MTSVAIAQHNEITQSIHQALSALDLASVVEGKRVAIKPNDTWASREDTSAVTQGDSLRAVIEAVKQHRPASITVTGGAGAAETDDVFRLSAMMDAIESQGVEFFDHNRPPFEEVQLRHGPQRSVQVNPRVREYERLIVLSQLKVHRMATVTLALKNIAMSFPAADYYGHPRGSRQHEHHFFQDLHAFIAAMAQAFPIDLAITVGHPAMVSTGPIAGYTVETGLTIASRDALAADVVGARILGFGVQAVRHLWEARRLGIGEAQISRMEFPLMRIEEAYERFTEQVYGRRLRYKTA